MHIYRSWGRKFSECSWKTAGGNVQIDYILKWSSEAETWLSSESGTVEKLHDNNPWACKISEDSWKTEGGLAHTGYLLLRGE